MIAKIKEEVSKIVTERLFAAHSPYINKPDFVAGFLRRAAGKNVK